MKSRIIIIIFLSYLFFIFFLVNFFLFKEQKIAVLTYHEVVNGVVDKNSVNISVDYFEKQMKWLSTHHYRTITMDEFYDWKKGKIKLPRKSVLITFDDGWKSIYTNALPIMEKYKINSNVFVVWKYYEICTSNNNNTYINENDVKDITMNHKSLKVLSHSYNLHYTEVANSKSYDKYSDDMKIVSKFDNNIKYYAYPFGIYNKQYVNALKDNGYKLAFTFGPYDFASKNDDDYKIPREGVFESIPFWKFKLKLILKS